MVQWLESAILTFSFMERAHSTELVAHSGWFCMPFIMDNNMPQEQQDALGNMLQQTISFLHNHALGLKGLMQTDIDKENIRQV